MVGRGEKRLQLPLSLGQTYFYRRIYIHCIILFKLSVPHQFNDEIVNIVRISRTEVF